MEDNTLVALNLKLPKWMIDRIKEITCINMNNTAIRAALTKLIKIHDKEEETK